MTKIKKNEELSDTLEQLTNLITDIRDIRYLAIALLQYFDIKCDGQDVSSLIVKDAYKTLNKTIIYKLADNMDELEIIKNKLNIEQ